MEVNLFAGMWRRECLRVIVPPTTLGVSISRWAPFSPATPAAFLYMTKGSFVLCFFSPCIQTSTLKNPFLTKAKTSSNDSWSGAENSPINDDNQEREITARMLHKQFAAQVTLPSSKFSSRLIGLFQPQSFSLAHLATCPVPHRWRG